MNPNTRARLLVVGSMAIFGTLGPFVRNISVSSGELALYRALMATVIIGLYLLFARQPIPVRKIRKSLVLLLISGAAMGVNWILLFEAYKYTTVSAATLSYYFAPVIVTLLCPLFFRERLTGKQLFCFVMSTLGIILITGSVRMRGGRDLIGILFGLGAAVLYASVVLLNKYIRDVDGIHRTFLQFVAAAVTLLPYVLCTGGVTLGTMDGRGWICLAAVGLIHTGAAYCMYFTALKDLPGQTAAILSYIDPLTAVIISVAVLRETITPLQILGGALILGFTLFGELTQKKSALQGKADLPPSEIKQKR